MEEKLKTEEIEESNQLLDLINQAKKLELIQTTVNYFKYISKIYIIFILLYIIILLIYNFFFFKITLEEFLLRPMMLTKRLIRLNTEGRKFYKNRFNQERRQFTKNELQNYL